MADVVVTMESDVARLIRDQEKVIRKQSEQIDKFKQMARDGKDAGTAGSKAGKDTESSWSRASASMTTMIGRYASMAAAIGVVTQSLARMKQQQDEAMSSFDMLEESNRRLRSIATPEEDAASMQARADALSSRYGVSRAAARDIIFQQKSLGMSEEDAERIARGSLVVDPALAAEVGGQMPRLFPESKITPMQGIDLIIKAAQQSMADPQQMAQAFPTAAAGLGATGATPAETGAALAMLRVRLKSTLTASERLGSMGQALSESEEFGGRGLIGGIQALQAATPEERDKFLGKNKELNQAFRLLTEEFEAIRKQVALQEQSAGTLEQQLALVEPTAMSAQALRGQQAAREAAMEQRMATGGFESRGAVEREMQRLESQRFRSPFTEFGAEQVGSTLAGVGLGPTVSAVGTRIAADLNPINLLQSIAETLKAIHTPDAAEKLDAAADKLNRILSQPTPEQSLSARARAAASVPQE